MFYPQGACDKHRLHYYIFETTNDHGTLIQGYSMIAQNSTIMHTKFSSTSTMKASGCCMETHAITIKNSNLHIHPP